MNCHPRPNKPHVVIIDDGTGTWGASYFLRGREIRGYGSTPTKAEAGLSARWIAHRKTPPPWRRDA